MLKYTKTFIVLILLMLVLNACTPVIAHAMSEQLDSVVETQPATV